ncbi:indolepyruvate ferredoxin oxidoreductase family protein [Streptomyces sp. CLV115]|uniref:indolepyruvate ferredoxin oxidoreductase family protein n=1 Tax=Streptomyces sp. CLV115 TaxID=3138502 RepID=UPI00313A838F
MTKVETRALGDRYAEVSGSFEFTGVQALTRLPMDVRRADLAAGKHTAAYISGYEGSPLGGYDLELARQRSLLDELHIVFQPAVNEELAATAVQGTQLASGRPEKRFEGVTGFWYGKSPGLDRASDSFRHSNLCGTHPSGGAVAIVGDDPAAKSSTVPGSSEALLADLGMPTLFPSSPANALHLGMHAVQLSRASGLWVALKIVTNVADGTGLVTLPRRFRPAHPEVVVDGQPYRHEVTASLLQPALTRLEASRNGVRLEIARRYAAMNDLNRWYGDENRDRIGIVAAGKTFIDVLQALELLGLDETERERRGLRLLELQMIHPLEPSIVSEFARGLSDIVVIEEKRSFIEIALKDQLYGRANAPAISGKRRPDGLAGFADSGELDPDTIAEILASVLLDHPDFPSVEAWKRDRRQRRGPMLLPLVTRTPFFCSGCPHNRSAQVPDGALVGGGIGCHGLVLGMAPEQVGEVMGLTQMGGEGTQWLGMAPFIDRPHIFQNIGDGTFHHSGSLAVRAAVAGGANITYKLLYNSTVAMTGGQHAQGAMAVPQLTQSLLAEGVTRIIVTTDDLKSYQRVRLPKGVSVMGRERLIEAQETLANTPGVTVLIHDQECATELRRKRKRGLAVDPTERVMINQRICEGCGDCGRKSNCLSVHPVETEFGRKTRIDQSSCNKDYSCLDGDCPAFVTVVPGGAKRSTSRKPVDTATLPAPQYADVVGHHTTRVLGIGGSGVVTLSQVLTKAANIARLDVVTLDQTGLAQKGGAVVSDVKVGPLTDGVASKAVTAEVDLYIGADLLVAADPRHLSVTRAGHTTAVISTATVPTGAMATDITVHYPDKAQLRHEIGAATDPHTAVFVDARRVCRDLFGDDQSANLFLTGIAVQLGALPIPLEAIEEAIGLNGVRVDENIQAFRRGRQFVANRRDFDDAVTLVEPSEEIPSPTAQSLVLGVGCAPDSDLGRLIAVRAEELIRYQNAAYASRYVDAVTRAHRAEKVVSTDRTPFTEAVARNLHKLMAYKDEYEVARLALDPAVAQEARAEFGDGVTLKYRLHPPVLRALGMKRKLKLGSWFRWVFRALVILRHVRGTPFDLFGYAKVRKVERRLVQSYMSMIDAVSDGLQETNTDLATRIADAPDIIRGYEEVKLANVERYEQLRDELLAEFEHPAVRAAS